MIDLSKMQDYHLEKLRLIHDIQLRLINISNHNSCPEKVNFNVIILYRNYSAIELSTKESESIHAMNLSRINPY